MSFLNANDKEDMLAAVLGYDELEAAVVAWKDMGMPHISGNPLPKTETQTPVNQGIVYRKPFVSHIEVTRGED